MKPFFTAATAALTLTACVNAPAAQTDYASLAFDLSTPERTAQTMMLAMYMGDAQMVDRVFLGDATLRRATPEGVRPDGLTRWRDWVGEQEIGDADEQLFDVEVKAFGHLASVWAPFVITYKGEIAGCGVNQMTMAKVSGSWRVVSAMDTQAEKSSCATFRESYSAN